MKRNTKYTKRITCVIVLSVVSLVSALCACSPQPSSQTTEAPDAEETTMQGDFTFSTDSKCTMCHEVESASMSNSECAASLHATLTCLDCHNDVNGLTAAHDGVAYGDTTAKRLKSTEVAEETCLTEACHGSYAVLAELTASSTVLTDKNGTVVNPHALPENEEHKSVTCGNCHNMHDSEQLSESAPKACQGCHHMGVYECYTCHD